MLNFPFSLGKLYSHHEIREKLKIGNSGGIRPSNENKIVVLFWNAPHKQRDDNFGKMSNIYLDRIDPDTGLYYYTGEGQEGDQTLGGNNGRIVGAKENDDAIHFFRQYVPGGPRQYMGEVEFLEYSVERQPDRNNIERNVYLFILKPLADPKVLFNELAKFVEENMDIKDENLEDEEE